MSTPKAQSSLFLAAAQLIHDRSESFACHALSRAATGDIFHSTAETKVLAAYFEPEYHHYSYWWPIAGHREERILALLLCAEMTRPARRAKVAAPRRRVQG